MKSISYITIITIALSLIATGCKNKPTTHNNESTPVVQAESHQNDDVFKFTIDSDSFSNEDNPINIVINSVDGKYPVKYDLDCEGDGEFEFTNLTEDQKCLYKKNTGKHQIWLRGEIPGLHLCRSVYNADAIISVDDWGNIEWKTMESFASGCDNLNKLPENAPNLSQVTDMTRMFHDAVIFNQPLEKWDVSNVKIMSEMFSNAKSFNQPLEKWDVSNIEIMFGLFSRARSFNQPLEKWDVSNVKNMVGLFSSAKSFNQPLENWDVSNVNDMNGMFNSAISFNQPLEKWDVSNVNNMNSMFIEAKSFNQPLENWDVSNVEDMGRMFSGAKSFNQPLEKWDVSNVKNMGGMFESTELFNQPLEKWDVSNVEDMSRMFESTELFNQPLEKWDVSNVEDMSRMFSDAKSFNQPLEKWDVSGVRNMNEMFGGAKSFNQPLENWKMPLVKNMAYMFYNTVSFNQPLENWNVSTVGDMSEMFSGAKSFNQPLNKWDVSKVRNMDNMFKDATAFKHYPDQWIICPGSTSTEDMFTGSGIQNIAEKNMKKINQKCPVLTRKMNYEPYFDKTNIKTVLHCQKVPDIPPSVKNKKTKWGVIQKTEWNWHDDLLLYDEFPVFSEDTEAHKKINTTLAQFNNQRINVDKAWEDDCERHEYNLILKYKNNDAEDDEDDGDNDDYERIDTYKHTFDANVLEIGSFIEVLFDENSFDLWNEPESYRYSFVFDKTSGNLLSLKDIYPLSEVEIKSLIKQSFKSYLDRNKNEYRIEHYLENNELTEDLVSYIDNLDIKKFNFYITKEGEVIITFDKDDDVFYKSDAFELLKKIDVSSGKALN